ncbi:hypothetical protein N7520_006340 [Penicillium odoratum]|uniref:uncharacterized protein n=1 Tax=Penicillium odoratum TaxID=1167516 RepID=UPI002548590C|nr:uncharacterized protein N7520_006340 [Penicillium odoratum]KAJ5759184.1 hypothetical protein N7520_006340 [Penicillium odoratum]
MSQQAPGLADLEKELGCSICTELLYQPLTLLDCLHTYCGSCVKEWFTAQASREKSQGSPRFTCPSCRADVRGTRPNATVTTLLDMVLMAKPDRGRSEAEKQEIAERYKPGDSVFPPPRTEAESSEDEDDQRLMEEVRDVSLRENRVHSRREERREERRRTQPETSRARSSNPENRHTDDGRSRRRREEDAERQRRIERAQAESEHARRVEHQSSLRSLISMSSETETMEQEILRQIMEEGLLQDIDLESLGPAQEEELSERIAAAYRRKHMEQSGARPAQRPRQSSDGTHRSHGRSNSAHRSGEITTTSRDASDRRPPLSRPHLLDSAAPHPPPNHHRSNSEQGSGNRRASPVRVNQASNSDDTLRPAVRSSSDMTSERPRSSHNGRESSSQRSRRATGSEQPTSDVWTGGRERASARQTSSQSVTNSPTSAAPSNASHTSTPPVPVRSDRRPRPASSRPNAPPSSNLQYAEPSISCDRCGKTNIQYDLHKRCLKCNDGNYHLCLQCYRLGRGCLQWCGFASTAQSTFERMLASSNGQPVTEREGGHILSSFKYQRPVDTAQITTNGEMQMTNDNPAHRLEVGLFCDICRSSANECYWKCSRCNDGDWGFCNRCVNQGRCCTHPLLPVRYLSGTSAPNSSAPVAVHNAPVETLGSYKILSFSTNCDICTYPIPASVTRFHCLQCNSGDYDVCTNCYYKLVATSKISKENGYSGWRRCLAGHRMINVGFEDHQDGQRRVVVKALVGGHALKDEHVNQSPTSPTATAPIASPELGIGDWSWKEGQDRRKKASRARNSLTFPIRSHSSDADSVSQNGNTPTSQHASALRRFPPDGGVGLIVFALWSYYPEEGVQDELVFPRGADITEVENINDDWFWGCYAGRTGLFPGSRVTPVGEIQ